MYLGINSISPMEPGSECQIAALPVFASNAPHTCGALLEDNDGDSCGDITKPSRGDDNPGVVCLWPNHVTVKCLPESSTSRSLVIPACFAYDNSARTGTNACTGPGPAKTQTAPGTGSKCGCLNPGLVLKDITVPVADPKIELLLTSAVTEYTSAGLELTVTACVKNTGNVGLTNVTVSYPGQPSLSCPPLNVVTEETQCLLCTGDFKYITTAEDVTGADGKASMTATATGHYTAGGVTVTDTASVTWTLKEEPDMTFEKVATTSTYADVGDVINYHFTITNTGNVPFSTLTLTDAKLDAGSLVCTPTYGLSLPAAAGSNVMTCTGRHTIATEAEATSTQITNTATATYTTAGGMTGNKIATAVVWGSELKLALDVTVSDQYYSSPSNVSFQVTVNNPSNVSLTNVALTLLLEGSPYTPDSCTVAPAGTIGGTAVAAWPLLSLAAGAVVTCNVDYAATQQDLNTANTVTLQASVTAAGPSGGIKLGPLTDSEESKPSIKAMMTLDLENDATDAIDTTGPVTYTLTVTNNNTGNVDLSLGALVLTSTGNGSAPSINCGGSSGLPATLALGSSITCKVTYVVTMLDLETYNTDPFTVTATLPATGGGTAVDPTPTDSAERNTDGRVALDMEPAARVNDVVASKYSAVGDQVTFTATLTNTGNVFETLNLGSVKVGSSATPVEVVSCEPSSPVAPGAKVTCTTAAYSVTQADIDAGLITVRLDGTALNPSLGSATEVDTVVVHADAQPELTLVKTIVGSSNYSAPGDQIQFKLVASNTGNIRLFNVAVKDAMIPNLAPAPDTNASACGSTATGVTLDVGATIECVGTYTVVQADIEAGSIVNDGSVSGKEPSWAVPEGGPVVGEGGSAPGVVGDTDKAVAAANKNPVLKVTKTADDTTPEQQGVVTYTIVASNGGNVIIKGVTVSDPLLSNMVCTPAQGTDLVPKSSAAGDSNMTCTGSITFDAAAFEGAYNGHTNTATVTSTTLDKDGQALSQKAQEVVTAAYKPEITVEVVCPDTAVTTAGTVTCTITVTNTGNWGLTGLSSTQLTGCNLTPASAPGGVATCDMSVTVSQTDMEKSTHIDVPVTVAGTTNVAEKTVSATGSDVVIVDLTPVVTLQLTADKTTISAAATTVTYTLTVTNPDPGSNTQWTMGDTSSSIGGLTPTWNCVATTLALGGSTTCKAEVDLPANACSGQSLTATASMTVKAPNGETASATTQLSIPCQAVAPEPCTADGSCPAEGTIENWFTSGANVVMSCTNAPNCAGTITIKSPFVNGKCINTQLSWVAAGVEDRQSVCKKVDGVSQGRDIVLTGLKNGDKVFLYAHDGSFGNKYTSVYNSMTTGATSLAKGCRSNSKIQNCGPYPVTTFKCPAASGCSAP